MAQINKPDNYFNTVLYTGDGSASRDITVGFQPDWVWVKCRSNTENHTVADSVRGGSKNLEPNLTNAERTFSTVIPAFVSNGFTVGSSDYVNGNTKTYASWSWLGGGTASSNTDGSITSTVSANTTSGFSIATWVGTGSNGSVGHGLSGVDFMIIKDRDNSRNWYTWNKTFAYNDRIKLDTTDAKETGTDNMTALPDSTKINMSTSTQNNGSGINYVGYFFQEKKGFSKFGSYTGNGSTDGTFVYTGFKPAFVIVKRTNATEDWFMFDNKRSASGGSNVLGERLKPNTSDSGYTTAYLDFLSNGFKWRVGGTGQNGSGDSYIYMCFAENPLVGTNNIPATAR